MVLNFLHILQQFQISDLFCLIDTHSDTYHTHTQLTTIIFQPLYVFNHILSFFIVILESHLLVIILRTSEATKLFEKRTALSLWKQSDGKENMRMICCHGNDDISSHSQRRKGKKHGWKGIVIFTHKKNCIILVVVVNDTGWGLDKGQTHHTHTPHTHTHNTINSAEKITD